MKPARVEARPAATDAPTANALVPAAGSAAPHDHATAPPQAAQDGLSAAPPRESTSAAAGAAGEAVVTWIRPRRGMLAPNLRELVRYRELLYFLVWRDVKVRYKQTVMGASWAILQPVAGMAVFSLFFGRLAGLPSDGVPYPVFAFAALVPWTFFANGLTLATGSLVASQNLLRRVYFPRLAIPTAAVLSSLVDFVLAFAVLLVMMAGYGTTPRLAALAVLPLLVLLAFATSLGMGLWLSALNVRYRDIGYMAPFLTQIWLFATPIAYPSSLLGEPWRTLYGINPMAGVVEGFRWALLGTDTAPGGIVLVSALVSLALLVGGAFYFRQRERTFADVV